MNSNESDELDEPFTILKTEIKIIKIFQFVLRVLLTEIYAKLETINMFNY